MWVVHLLLQLLYGHLSLPLPAFPQRCLDLLLNRFSYLPTVALGLGEIKDLQVLFQFEVSDDKGVLAVDPNPPVPEVELDV